MMLYQAFTTTITNVLKNAYLRTNSFNFVCQISKKYIFVVKKISQCWDIFHFSPSTIPT